MRQLLTNLVAKIKKLGRARPAARPQRRVHLAVERFEERLVLSIAPTGSPMDVSSAVLGGQSLHSSRTVAEAANGNSRVVWEDGGVMTRLFDGNGKALTDAVRVGATTSSDSEATVAM